MTNRVTYSLLFGLFCLIFHACAGEVPKETQPANTSAVNERGQTPSTTPTMAPATSASVTATAYNVAWVSNKIPSTMQSGKEQNVAVTFKNTSNVTWPSKDIAVSYHWFKNDKMIDNYDGLRTGFPRDMAPGEQITIDKVRVLTPKQPGVYQLQLTLVQENVAWFENKGASTLTVPVTIR